MCSSDRWTPRFLALAMGLILALALGCGHKENPKPPPQKIPQPIRDLVVAQRGDRLLFSFGYPQTTVSGLPIDDVAAIELFEFEIAVPDFAPPADEGDDADEEGEAETGGAPEPDDEESAGEPESGDREPAEEAEERAAAPARAEPAPEGQEAAEPGAPGVADEGFPDDEPAAGDEDDEGEGGATEDDEDDVAAAPVAGKESLLEVDPREFESAAKLRLRLEGEELTNAVRGDRVELSLILDKIDPDEKVGLVWGVRSFQRLDRASRFSNLVKIVPRVTPDPPAELVIEPVRNGVKLSWTFEGEEPEEFRFYRRDALAPAFGQYFGVQSGDAEQFLDASAEFGSTYTYAMTVVVNRAPLVESAFTPEREIEYLDAFPPETPTDLVVLTEVGTARLLWEGSSDRDLAGYVVYRRDGAREFERLNERPLREAEYSDTEAVSGRTYAYRVVAVDRGGNMSDPSEEVEVRIP